MPAPLEYNNIWRMNINTAPTNDIDFDAYDFQLCRPQTDIKDAFESRELEASYCRDFACCGLILTDLHDLLQHYEEWHVPLEEDSELYNDDDEFDANFVGMPPFDAGSLHLQHEIQQQQQQHDDDDPVKSSKELAALTNYEDFDINSLKKKAAAYLTELCQQQSDTSTVGTPSATTDDDDDDDDDDDERCSYESIRFDCLEEEPTAKTASKKRSFDTAMEQIAQTAVKKLALASSTTNLGPTTLSTIDGATPSSCLGMYFTDQEFLAHAGALLASSAHQSSQNADKPYKCPVQGCDKAYKNPNGLKYHNQHGHCNLATDENENVASKPYQCALGGCGKRYKNLNGLKYHIEHSHVAALSHTLATFGSSFFQQQCRQPSSLSQSSSLSPSSSPELSCVSLPF